MKREEAKQPLALGFSGTADLLVGRSRGIGLCSLLDLPRAWPHRHRESEGSTQYRHSYIARWFHFEDPRLDFAARTLRGLMSGTWAPA
jgi:hypothetical protein